MRNRIAAKFAGFNFFLLSCFHRRGYVFGREQGDERVGHLLLNGAGGGQRAMEERHLCMYLAE